MFASITTQFTFSLLFIMFFLSYKCNIYFQSSIGCEMFQWKTHPLLVSVTKSENTNVVLFFSFVCVELQP